MACPRPYNSVKEAFEAPYIKKSISRTLGVLVNKAKKNRYIGNEKNIGQDIEKSILEYPKIILEPSDFEEDFQMVLDDFKTVDKIKLPFPKLIIFKGELVDTDFSDLQRGKTNYMNGTLSKTQDGRVNVIYTYFISEYYGGIRITMLFGDENIKKEKSIVYTHNTLVQFNNESGIHYAYSKSKPKVEQETVELLIEDVLIAIHKMTMRKNNYYMSVPTPEEAKINRSRTTKGKKPLIRFETAVIEGKKTMMSSTGHGTHASPCLHWRRGHWRTISKSGKKIWIDPMEVGDEANGKIIKTYAIGKYSLLEAR